MPGAAQGTARRSIFEDFLDRVFKNAVYLQFGYKTLFKLRTKRLLNGNEGYFF